MSPAVGAIELGVVVAVLVRASGGALGSAVGRARSRRFVDRVDNPAPAPGFAAAGAARISSALVSAGLGWDAHMARRWWIRVTAVTTVVVVVVAGPGAVVVVVLAAVGGPWVALRALAGRAEAGYDATLAAALDAAARSVRSGASLHLAIDEAATAVRGAVATDLRRVAVASERGASMVDALEQWSGIRPRPAVRLVAGALALAVETGGAPARMLDDVGTALRQRHQVEREAHALAAQARLSAIVVGAAPVAFTAIASATDARHARVLFTTPVGLSCLVVGLVLDGTGALWMHRLSRSVSAW